MANLLAHIKSSDPAQRRSAGRIFKFLALLVAFTIIARGASGTTLARVVIAAPDRSEIIDSISGTATVSSTDTHEIVVPELLTIAEMLVGIGQYVQAGDAIAIFEMEDLEQRRIREGASLSRLNLDLEQLIREENIDASSLETAERNLNRAREDYNATVQQGQADIENARAELEFLMDAAYAEGYILPAAVRSHRRALEDYFATLAQGDANIAAAEENLRMVNVSDTALQAALRSHERALEDYETAVAQNEAAIAAAEENLAELRAGRPTDHNRTALETAERAYRRAKDDYASLRGQAGSAIDAAIQSLNNALATYQSIASLPDPNPQALESARAAVEQAISLLTAAQNNAQNEAPALLQAARRVEDEASRLAQAQRDFTDAIQNALEQAENALEAAKTQAAISYQTASRRLEDEVIRLAQAEADFENSKETEVERLENALQAAKDQAERSLQVAARTLEDASNSVSGEADRAQTALQNAITRAAEDRQTAARQVENNLAALTTAQENHRRSVQQTADVTVQNIISASTLELDIASRQYTVDMLDTLIANGGILYSGYGGSVSMAMPAGYVTNSAPVIALRDTNGGFEAQLLISLSEAERLAIGSDAEVTMPGGSMFFTPTATAVISSISLPDEDDNVTVTLRLPYGSWSVGQRIDAQVILSRANYDLSVPVSAVHSDNAGYFLLVMEHRSTIMGLQNVVVRVNVTIVAADDAMVSVRGGVSRNSYVIVGSNRPVSVGDRVRVSE
ncbi:MAG: hypothetical protein FWC77_00145 [Defluviitaleaceae bacterium]|nr:hypothetical protein [Defluviitaleaceae bacterium]